MKSGGPRYPIQSGNPNSARLNFWYDIGFSPPPDQIKSLKSDLMTTKVENISSPVEYNNSVYISKAAANRFLEGKVGTGEMEFVLVEENSYPDDPLTVTARILDGSEVTSPSLRRPLERGELVSNLPEEELEPGRYDAVPRSYRPINGFPGYNLAELEQNLDDILD